MKILTILFAVVTLIWSAANAQEDCLAEPFPIFLGHATKLGFDKFTLTCFDVNYWDDSAMVIGGHSNSTYILNPDDGLAN